jgi:hypothetical protein
MPTLMHLLWPPTHIAAQQDGRPPWEPTPDDVVEEIGELLDVRVDAGRSTVGLLIVADGEHVRVIVAREVLSLRWDVGRYGGRTLGRRYAREIGTCLCTPTSDGSLALRIGVGFTDDFRLTVTAAELAHYWVRVEGLPDAPPDYTELGDAEIARQRPDWTSSCEVLYSSHRHA